jgi:hypothetical protein
MKRSRMAITKLSILILATALALIAQPGTGQAGLKGHIVDQGGHPVPNAAVRYIRQPVYAAAKTHGNSIANTLAPGESALHASTHADASGAFHAAALPPGDYLLCAHAAGYLDSCKWGLALSAKAVGSAETRDLTAITLTQAASVLVQVNDPLGLLPKRLDPTGDNGLILGIMTPGGAFFGAQPSLLSGGRTYQLSLPFGRQMFIWVFSHSFTLVDAKGNQLPAAGSKIPIQVPAGSQTIQITIQVRGKV